MKYNPKVVTAFFKTFQIPEPFYEHHFHPERRWRFDLSWPHNKVAVEVDGGIWIRGGHNRGAQMKKDWEKRNAAAALGWRILYFEPEDLCTTDTAKMIYLALIQPEGRLAEQCSVRNK